MGKRELIKELKNDVERVCKSVLDWERRRTKKLKKVLNKIERRGTDKFTRLEKVIISEWAAEFGQQVAKIPVFMTCIERLNNNKPVKYPGKKFPSITEFFFTHKTYPEINIKYHDAKGNNLYNNL